MQKRSILSALAGVLVLAVLAVFVARNVTPASASARQILDRAYAVQSQQTPEKGIQHIRNEIHINLEALPEKPGTDTTVESYLDLRTGNSRLVTIDNKTGKVLEAYAYDGTNAYSSESTKDGQPSDGPLTIYRSPQHQPGAITEKLRNSSDSLDAKTMFDRMRSDPNVQFAGKETWNDGRAVYVLRSEQPIKVILGADTMQRPMGLVTIFFDVDTYELIGNRVTIEKDGQEVLVTSQRVLVEEILPEGSSVAWDLSDLQGVNIVDDTRDEHGLPEVISVETLATRTQSAYLLHTIPDGFSLEISALPEQPANKPFFYRALYTKGEDYFMIRIWGEPLTDTSWADETYRTASGLVFHFITEPGVTRAGGQFTSALVEAPNGMTYAVNSTLPRETIKALAEELVLVK